MYREKRERKQERWNPFHAAVRRGAGGLRPDDTWSAWNSAAMALASNNSDFSSALHGFQHFSSPIADYMPNIYLLKAISNRTGMKDQSMRRIQFNGRISPHEAHC